MKEAEQCIPITQPPAPPAALMTVGKGPRPPHMRAGEVGPGGSPLPGPSAASAFPTSAGPAPVSPARALAQAALRCVSAALVPALLPHGVCVPFPEPGRFVVEGQSV